MRDQIAKSAANAVCGNIEQPALEALLSQIMKAMYGIKEAEERFRYSIDRLGADVSDGKTVGPQSPIADTFISRLREAAEFAENMRDDLHEQATRLNRMV